MTESLAMYLEALRLLQAELVEAEADAARKVARAYAMRDAIDALRDLERLAEGAVGG